MRDDYRILDTDCNQMESPTMRQEYIDPAFRDRAPERVESGGRLTMMVEGESLVSEGKYPFSAPEFLAALGRGMQRFKRLREAHFSAEARLRDM